MDMFLKRTLYWVDGIFGELSSDDGSFYCRTLEHSYPGSDDTTFFPILPSGTYVCERGHHIQAFLTDTLETFQIMDVAGQSDIIFNIGNVNIDSFGAILLGENVVQVNGQNMLSLSKSTFKKFMNYHDGKRSFRLTVLG